jgi:hypothetical protein
MQAIVLLALIFAPPSQDEEAVRQRILKLVEFLEGVLPDTRTQAATELRSVPVRFAPFIRDLCAAHKNPDVRAVLEPLAVPNPWAEMLRGSLGDVAALVQAIRGAESQPRRAAVARALYLLSERAPADIRRWSDLLLADADRRLREFAVQMCKYWPPENTASLRALLKDREFGRRAAEALISAGDEGAVPAALESFRSSDIVEVNSARSILLAFGVGESDVDNVIETFKRSAGATYSDPPILGPRAGRKGIGALVEMCRGGESRTSTYSLELLAWLSGEEALPIARERGVILDCLRDPKTAHAWLEAAGPEPNPTVLGEGRKVAWYAGPELRDPILRRLQDRAVRLSFRKELITMLGVAGRPEDVPFLAESLGDARLADAAAEALEKLGDRSHGPALYRALLEAREGQGLPLALVTLDVEGSEDDLVELLSDPVAYGSQSVLAVRLAGRRLTPRLLGLILESYPKWSEYMQRAVERMILVPDRRGDAELIKRLLAGENADLKSLGHHLAMLNGDLSGARAAAEGARIKGVARNPLMGGFRLDAGAAAGDAWTDAVEAEWRLSPDWYEGAVWLAARGRKDAMDKIRTRLATETGLLVFPMTAALAAGGDSEQLEKIWGRAFTASFSPEEDEVLFALARRGHAPTLSRILALARSEAVHSHGTGHRLAARLTLPEALPLFRLAVSRCDQGYHGGARPFELAACIQALARLKDAGSMPAIRRHIRSGNEVVRIAAMDAAAEFGDRESVRFIARLIDDPTDTRRQGPAGWIYDAPPVRRVWHHAMEALEKITGEKPPAGRVVDRRDFWRAWSAKNAK